MCDCVFCPNEGVKFDTIWLFDINILIYANKWFESNAIRHMSNWCCYWFYCCWCCCVLYHICLFVFLQNCLHQFWFFFFFVEWFRDANEMYSDFLTEIVRDYHWNRYEKYVCLAVCKKKWKLKWKNTKQNEKWKNSNFIHLCATTAFTIFTRLIRTHHSRSSNFLQLYTQIQHKCSLSSGCIPHIDQRFIFSFSYKRVIKMICDEWDNTLTWTKQKWPFFSL